MPTVIPASKWQFDVDQLDTGFQPNHGQKVTTEDILKSMDDIENRVEMQKLDSMLRESAFYLPGKQHV